MTRWQMFLNSPFMRSPFMCSRFMDHVMSGVVALPFCIILSLDYTPY